MKPGGRNNVTNFDDWVRMDLEYINHWSLSLDLLILLRTSRRPCGRPEQNKPIHG
jgi:lipopolysaccharide/colanic/teichoic acid biosynthesis glycosyltransferase